ncbi:unnamed protein product [Candidula unifasciata]|uniref:Thioredoxin domain-containing protein n=1 Tax=Candidula unifasciata TaxID=100452 RepID=A0A8S3ZUA1_9EUPU|nr:unnamed protein product [Candidula unifasciata]
MAHLVAILGDTVEGKDGARVGVSSLADNDLLGLYFSAHWCPPCRNFTPVLVECYKSVTAAGKKWQIVFISFDRDITSCKDYYNTMPWLLLPFDSDLKEQLSETYGVRGIPALIFIDPKTGKLITANGRQAVEQDKTGEKFPWK